MADSSDPSIDPIEAFIWLFSQIDDPDGHRSAEIAKRIHLALSTDEVLILDRACREALKNYQRKVMGTDLG